MALELVNRVAVAAIVTEELEDHVLEVWREASAIYLFKVGLDLAGQEQIIEVLLFPGFLEWEDALDDDKDNDANAE